MSQTIFALATPPGRAAVAVMRLSGPAARDAVQRLAGSVPKARRAALRTLRDEAGRPIDRALVLWFPRPASYTGEDSAEFHLHGGTAVVDAVVRALQAAGLRLAEAGEFTRRAFENGKLDLGQAEAVADLVDAQCEAQARQAIGQLEGALGRRYEAWRGALVEALARLEAAVDFPDEEVPGDAAAQARGALERLGEDLALALADEARGRRVREGYRVAIIGAPNAGKSSLLNALAGRDAAIVTPIAGTTRDVIEVPITLAGYRIVLADTAGLRSTTEAIEAESVRRATHWARAADLRLWVVDAAESSGAWREALGLVGSRDLCLLNKSDLPEGTDARNAGAAATAIGAAVSRLSIREAPASAVVDLLTDRVVSDLAGADFPAATRLRHARRLVEAKASLDRALDSLAEPELAAEDVRLAARALARITGRFGAEEVLGEVFATFCIGK